MSTTPPPPAADAFAVEARLDRAIAQQTRDEDSASAMQSKLDAAEDKRDSLAAKAEEIDINRSKKFWTRAQKVTGMLGQAAQTLVMDEQTKKVAAPLFMAIQLSSAATFGLLSDAFVDAKEKNLSEGRLATDTFSNERNIARYGDEYTSLSQNVERAKENVAEAAKSFVLPPPGGTA